MENFLVSLYKRYVNEKNSYKAERIRIYCNERKLKKTLNESERKLLLRIRDDSDLIVDKASTDSFSNGVNIGMRLMLEVLYHTYP